MATVGLLKLLNIVEQEHHLNLLEQQHVALIALGVVVQTLEQVVAYNIGQEHAPEQIAAHLLRLTQETVVLRFVDLGVTG